MSFLSWVKFVNARSISVVSVLASTTRKLRCASGGSVTCCKMTTYVSWLYNDSDRGAGRNKLNGEVHTPIPARRRPVTEL